MNVVDLVIIVASVMGVFTGVRRGLIRILIDVVAMGASIFIATTYQERVSVILYDYLPLGMSYLTWVSFGVIWCAAFGAIMVMGSGIHRMLSFSIFGPINIVGGMVLGLIRNIVFIIPILMVFAFMDSPMLDESSLYKPLRPTVQYLLEDVLPEKLNQLKEKSKQSIQVPEDESTGEGFQEVIQEKAQDLMQNGEINQIMQQIQTGE